MNRAATPLCALKTSNLKLSPILDPRAAAAAMGATEAGLVFGGEFGQNPDCLAAFAS